MCIYVARTSNNTVITVLDVYCCLLPQCEALRTRRSGFPIATVQIEKNDFNNSLLFKEISLQQCSRCHSAASICEIQQWFWQHMQKDKMLITSKIKHRLGKVSNVQQHIQVLITIDQISHLLHAVAFSSFVFHSTKQKRILYYSKKFINHVATYTHVQIAWVNCI